MTEREHYHRVSREEYKSPASYIIIEPFGADEETYMGKVEFDNPSKRYNIGDLVFYHKNDLSEIIINSKKYHIVYYYNIILKKSLQKETELPKEPKLKFNGMDANF